MIKRILLWLLVVVAVVAISYLVYTYIIAPIPNVRPLTMVPKDAVYIIETEEPLQNWKDIRESSLWKHLRKHPSFADISAHTEALDQWVRENETLSELIAERPLLVSAHVTSKTDYEFLFVIDAQGVSRMSQVQNLLTTYAGQGFEVSNSKYQNQDIITFTKPGKDGLTVHAAFYYNLLVCSFSKPLLERTVMERSEALLTHDIRYQEIEARTEGGYFRLYVQYGYMDDFLLTYTGTPQPMVSTMSQLLAFTGAGISWEQDEEMLVLNGVTNLSDTVRSSLDALLLSGMGILETPEVAPQRTAFYTSLGFRSFGEWVDKWEESLKGDTSYLAYRADMARVERFLDINLREDFIGWVGDEVAFLQLQPSGLGRDNEFAVVLKAQNTEAARKGLDKIRRQIRRRTPVKFKTVRYRDYDINFLAVKGFFRMMIGRFFSDLQKPYYTIIDEYVIFSNHPQTLKDIIDDYEANRTLAYHEEFNAVARHFDRENSLFVYVQTPMLYRNLRGFVSQDSWNSLQQNRPYILCFKHWFLKMKADGDLFDTQMRIQFQDPVKVQEGMKAFEAKMADRPRFGMLRLNAEGQVSDTVSTDLLVEEVVQDEWLAVDEMVLDDLDVREFVEKYPSGQVRFEVEIREGLKHGDYREYHENGELRIKGRYRKDKREGLWKEFDREGNEVGRVRYKDGEKQP